MGGGIDRGVEEGVKGKKRWGWQDSEAFLTVCGPSRNTDTQTHTVPAGNRANVELRGYFLRNNKQLLRAEVELI